MIVKAFNHRGYKKGSRSIKMILEKNNGIIFSRKKIQKLMSNKKVTLHPEAFIHSDQGSHYTSPRYQKLLNKYGLRQSMSRKGNCWDNAPQKSFFGHLKDDVDYKSAKTLKELKAKINHYMVYYNNYRYQWNLKKMTPIQYRNHLLVA